MRPLKVGLVLPHWMQLPRDAPHWFATEVPRDVPRWSDVHALARQAEVAGFDSIWVFDHLLIRFAAVSEQFGRPVLPALAAAAPVGVWESWSLLAALAATTERVTLGTLVTCPATATPPCSRKSPTRWTRSAAGG